MTISRFDLFECIAIYEHQFLNADGSTCFRLHAQETSVRAPLKGGSGVILGSRAGLSNLNINDNSLLTALQEHHSFAHVTWHKGFGTTLIVSDEWWSAFKPQLERAILIEGTALYVTASINSREAISVDDVRAGKPLILPNMKIHLQSIQMSKEFEQ